MKNIKTKSIFKPTLYKKYLDILNKGVIMDTMNVRLKSKIKAILYKEYNSILDKNYKWTKFSDIIKNISNISKLFLVVIISIQSVVEPYNLSKDDKLQLASDILDDYLEFGWFLEFFDNMIIHILISYGVGFLNTLFGHNWNLEMLKNKILKL